MSRDIDETRTTLRHNAVDLPQVVVAASPRGAAASLEATLGVAPLVVGSAPESDLVLPDPEVSRRHCELSLTDRGIRLTDLGSKNGTFVAGLAIGSAIVPPGTIASLGESTLSIQIRDPKARLVVPLSTAASFGDALGASVPMRALFAQLEHAAKTPETVLLIGESGTGKELLARAIHAASSRGAGPFVVLDCSAVAPTLVESELFGHERGAFTGAVDARPGVFEQASGGTLFLDEIGELPVHLQPKLLRALELRQTRRLGGKDWCSFDARLLAATHRDLRALVAAAAFRSDLFYRLAVVEARVPPLRERKEDIPLLVGRMLAAHQPPRSMADLPPAAIEMLCEHSWPGNVRELRNTVTRLCLFPHLGAGAIDPVQSSEEEDVDRLLRLPLREARDVVIEEFERRYIVAKLREHGGNVSRTADAIRISRQLLHRLMERYRIRRDVTVPD